MENQAPDTAFDAEDEMPLARFHRRIQEKTENRGDRPIIIVALGDSVTQGVGYHKEFLHDDVYHAQLKRLLEAKYPLCIFSVINAGDDGQNAAGGLGRLERDVLHLQPDLLIIGYALNDAAGGQEAGLEEYGQNMAAIINRAREATEADIILLTPNMMPTRDNDNIPEIWKHVTGLFLHLQNDGVLGSYAQKLREVATELNVPVADVYDAWQGLAAYGVDTTAMLLNGLNHPDAEGHRVAADVLFGVIEKYQPSAG